MGSAVGLPSLSRRLEFSDVVTIRTLICIPLKVLAAEDVDHFHVCAFEVKYAERAAISRPLAVCMCCVASSLVFVSIPFTV